MVTGLDARSGIVEGERVRVEDRANIPSVIQDLDRE